MELFPPYVTGFPDLFPLPSPVPSSRDRDGHFFALKTSTMLPWGRRQVVEPEKLFQQSQVEKWDPCRSYYLHAVYCYGKNVGKYTTDAWILWVSHAISIQSFTQRTIGCTPNVRVLPWYLGGVQPWDSWG